MSVPDAEFGRELEVWTDWDVAAFYLARRLGVIGLDTRFHAEAKHIFWTDNPLGNGLNRILQELVGAGVLEMRDEPDEQYRWNADFEVLRRNEQHYPE
jgi:hypothetical protein